MLDHLINSSGRSVCKTNRGLPIDTQRGISYVQMIARAPDLLEHLIQNLPTGSDPGPLLPNLVEAWSFADDDPRGILGVLRDDGIRRPAFVRRERTLATASTFRRAAAQTFAHDRSVAERSDSQAQHQAECHELSEYHELSMITSRIESTSRDLALGET